MELNVQTAKLCVDAFFRASSQNLIQGIPASGMRSREGAGGSLPWKFCDRRHSERWGTPARRRLSHKLLASVKPVKFCCRVLEFEMSVALLNPNRDCC